MDPQGVDVVDGVVDGGSNIIENIISRRRWAVMIPIPRRRRPAEAAFHRSCVPSGPRRCHRFFRARRRRLADRRRLVSGINPFTGGSAQSIHGGVVVAPGRRAAPTAREAPSGVRQAGGKPAAALARGLGLLLHDQKECDDSGCAPRGQLFRVQTTTKRRREATSRSPAEGDPHARGRRLPERRLE